MTPPPQDLEERVQAYCRKAADCKILPEQEELVSPELIKRCARILVAAETVVEQRESVIRKADDENARVAGEEYGYYSRNPDPKGARSAYAAGRKAHQEIHGSAASSAKRLERLKIILTRHQNRFHEDLAQQFPFERLIGACDLIMEFASASKPAQNSLLPFRMKKSPMSLTCGGHAIVWCIIIFAVRCQNCILSLQFGDSPTPRTWRRFADMS